MRKPTVSVYDSKSEKSILKEMRLPKVFFCPLRQDIVQYVHDNISRNSRQAHGVDRDAGMKHSAESWGTGRAVSRVPRVKGSGTSRNGQAAFANMCRKGRMSFPLQTYRRWHRKINLRLKRHALASAISATAVLPLILARGHKINKVPQLPLVFDNEVNNIQKTKEAINLLKKFGCYDDIERVIEGKTIRAGVSKTRGKKYRVKKGPLVIVNDDGELLTRALRNIPGVDVVHVQRLNLKALAPGGQLGRFTIYTQSAMAELSKQFGTQNGSGEKRNYRLKREVISNPDINSIINSDQIQSILNDKKEKVAMHPRQRWNPLKNKSLMEELNPYQRVQSAEKKKKIQKDASKTKVAKEKAKKFLDVISSKVSERQQKDLENIQNILKITKI